MAINFSNTRTIPTQSIWNRNEVVNLPPLVFPDYDGPWGLRYLLIQHRENNDQFVVNYFKEGNDTGLNVRKQTTHLQPAWSSHNKIFEESKENGNLVWRVKVFNPLAMSIDYVEVWRSPDVLNQIWGNGLDDSGVRSQEDSSSLSKGLYESGFDVRTWKEVNNSWATVSKHLAIEWYFHFVDKWKNKDNCIINTPWDKNLNPWE